MKVIYIVVAGDWIHRSYNNHVFAGEVYWKILIDGGTACCLPMIFDLSRMASNHSALPPPFSFIWGPYFPVAHDLYCMN